MRKTIFSAILFFVCGNIFLSAQNNTGKISGTIADPTGAIVVNATITLLDKNQTKLQTAKSDSTGKYQFNGLMPNNYQVLVEANGFKKYLRTEIQLADGQNQEINCQLAGGDLADCVDCEGFPSNPTQTDEAKITRTFPEKELRDIPIQNNNPLQRSLPKSEKIVWQNSNGSAYGQRPTNNGQYLNGIYFADEFSGGGSLSISKEAVAETEILAHNALPEYGRNSGGIENIVSKAGGQPLHGSVYEYHNNSALSARNFFENTKAANHANVAGFTFGGAIKRDKIFIFTNYEINRRRGTSPLYFQGLTETERAQAVPAVKVLVDAYPKNPVSSARQFSLNTPNIFDANSFLTRGDVNVTDRNHLAMHVLRSTTQQQQSGAGNLLQSQAEIARQQWSAMALDTYLLNPTMNNEFQLGFSRLTAAPPVRDSSNVIIGDPRYFNAVGLLRVNGLNSVGVPISFEENRIQNIYQLNDNFTWIKSAHSFKFGTSIHKTQINDKSSDNTNTGQLTFLSIPDFLAGKPASFAKNHGYSYVGLRRSEWQGFVQDNWHLSSRSVLNWGLRYELKSAPREAHNRIAPKYLIANNNNNFAPRIGFAWQPNGFTKTVVRGGYGLFFDAIEMSFLGLTRFNAPLMSSFTQAAPVMNSSLGSTPVNYPSNVVTPAAKIATPFAQHWNLTIEQEFSSRIVASIAYVGTQGHNLTRAPAKWRRKFAASFAPRSDSWRIDAARNNRFVKLSCVTN